MTAMTDPISTATFAVLTLAWPLLNGMFITAWLRRRARRQT